MRISYWSSYVCSSDLTPLCRVVNLILDYFISGIVIPVKPLPLYQEHELSIQAARRRNNHIHRNEPIERKSVVKGKSVSVRVDPGGRSIIKKKTKQRHEPASTHLIQNSQNTKNR